MTGNHAGVQSSLVSVSPSSSSLHSNPLYRILRDLPLDKCSVHDIRLKFACPNLYTIIFSLISNKTLGYDCIINSRSKDILLPVWKIGDLLIKATIHRTDTVSVMIGCSLNPIVLDVTGIIRLTNSLSIVEERLSRLVKGYRNIHGPNVIEGFSPSHDCRSYYGIVPSHFEWIVTMWHFGADALVEYSGEKFSVTWETAEDVLIRAYSKVMNDSKTRIRLERQEYPKTSLADIIEQKLSSDRRFS
jgi:hypothetical protein